jgi:antitoxin YqcF
VAKPSDENKKLAKDIVGIFGGKPSVRDYFDDERKAAIDILTCENAPQTGVNSYCTLALSDYRVYDGAGNQLSFGIELAAACETEAKSFVNALSTCAFNIIKDRMAVYPGVVFPRVLDLYDGLSDTLSHAFLVDPFLWGDAFKSRKLETKTVAFLQMVPISDKEYQFLQENGADALEREFERKQIDVFNISRPSVVS